MNTKQIAKEILKSLRGAGAPVRTSHLIKVFGDQTSDALDFLGQKIIRIRGVGATVELA